MTGSYHRALLFVAAALVILTALCLTLANPRPRAADLAGWSLGRLRAELAARGLVYEGRDVNFADAGRGSLEPGCYLKRPGDARPWERLASGLRIQAGRWMPGFVAVVPALPFGPPEGCGPDEGRVELGRLLLLGDPAELRRILDTLGY